MTGLRLTLVPREVVRQAHHERTDRFEVRKGELSSKLVVRQAHDEWTIRESNGPSGGPVRPEPVEGRLGQLRVHRLTA